MFFRVDERDVRFTLFEHLKVQDLLELPAYQDHSVEVFEQILTEGARFAREALHPANMPSDQEGCKFEDGQVRFPRAFTDLYQQYCEGGWITASIPAESGGMGLPLPIDIATQEMFIAACGSFLITPALTRSAGHVIDTFGTDEQKATYCEKMFSGEWAGTMCLTEAGAGSAVGDLKTTARKEGDHYRITGTKIFISSGEHNLTDQIVHLVLARVEGAPAGIKGISLFIVPKLRIEADGSLGELNDVKCVGIEEKMGIHASATCSLAFGEDDNCLGYLIGEENHGIKYMFKMMNEARIGVGLQGLGLGAAAYEAALDYSKERIQGVDAKAFKDVNAPRVAIIKHPDVRRMLLHAKAYVEGIRALLLKAGLYADLSLHGPEADREKYDGLLGLLTPVCKAYGSEAGFKVTDLAMLVHGGYGYVREYGVEQYMRDVKIASIYEGTNGIQAIDLLARKVAAKGGMVFMSFIQEVNAFIEKNKEHPRLGKMVAAVEQARDVIVQQTMKFGEYNMSGELYYPLLHASPYLTSMGDFILGWLLTEQAVVADEKLQALGTDLDHPEVRFYDAKVKTADFFVFNQLPEIQARWAAVESGSRSALDIRFDGETA